MNQNHSSPQRRTVRQWKRIKTTAGVAAILCVLGPQIGTVISMMEEFHSIADGKRAVDAGVLAAEIETRLLIFMWLIPVAIGFVILSFFARHCLAVLRRTGQHDGVVME